MVRTPLGWGGGVMSLRYLSKITVSLRYLSPMDSVTPVARRAFTHLGGNKDILLEGPLDNTGRKLLQTGVRDAPNQPNLP